MNDAAAHVLREILSGDALSLPAAARLLPAHRGEGTTAPSTLWRWVRTGAKDAAGRLVRLEAARVGSHWLTNRAALSRFSAALTPPTDPPPAPAPKLTPAAQRREHEAAKARVMSDTVG